MYSLTSKSIVKRSADIVSREIEGELIIVPITSGIGDMEDELFTLNDTGKEIWSRIDGVHSLEDISTNLSYEYQAPLDVITKDVVGLSQELVNRRILEVTE